MFKELWKYIAGIFSMWRNTFYFYRKKREAMTLWKKTGRQWHIIPNGDKLLIWDNLHRKNWNKYAKKNKKAIMDYNTMLNLAYFSTPLSTNSINQHESLIKNSKSWLEQK